MRYFISRPDAFQAEHTQAVGMQMQFSDINFEYQESGENRSAEVIHSYRDFTFSRDVVKDISMLE